MGEPTYDRMRQEAEFWHEKHRQLVKAVAEIAQNTPHWETAEDLIGLKYDHSNALSPSPLDMDRVRKYLEDRRENG